MNAMHAISAAQRLLGEAAADFRSREYWKITSMAAALLKTAFLGCPHSVSIEPINECNLRCGFCSSPPALVKREKRKMSLAEFRKAVDSLCGCTNHLWLFLAGEPFLNPALPEMVSYAATRNMHVTVSTNATVLTPKLASEIVSSGLDRIIISLDGTTKETYEKMREGADFDEVVGNIKSLVAEKKKGKKTKPVVELQMIMTRINEHEAPAFARFAKGLGAQHAELKTLAIPEWVYGRRKVWMLREKFLPKKGKSRYTEDFRLKAAQGCAFTRRSIVLVDGTVCMCCYDINGEYSFGNIFRQPFGRIWNSEKYRKARKAMGERALPLCKRCAAV